MDSIKYQVFVSSTFTDLKEERKKILDILLEADCIPAGMENFIAQDDEMCLSSLQAQRFRKK